MVECIPSCTGVPGPPPENLWYMDISRYMYLRGYFVIAAVLSFGVGEWCMVVGMI